MKKIVLDIETRNTFAEVDNKQELLELSVVVAYDSETDKYYSFWQEDLPKLWPLLEQADLIIGYNSRFFDMPILNKYYAGDLTKFNQLDILEEIKKTLGHRISLDKVAEGTLGRHKSGHGLEAVEWWREGKLEEIRKYCEEDVRITKQVYDYAIANQHLKYMVVNEIKEVPLDTSKWEKMGASVNFTLPF